MVFSVLVQFLLACIGQVKLGQRNANVVYFGKILICRVVVGGPLPIVVANHLTGHSMLNAANFLYRVLCLRHSTVNNKFLLLKLWRIVVNLHLWLKI